MGTPEEIDAYLSKIPSKETIPEQWCPQIYARILHKHRMILVSQLDDETVRACNMIPAKSVDDALQIALEMKGADASVVVIPDAYWPLPRRKSNYGRRKENCPQGQ